MIIIFAPVNKHSYTVPADKLMWAILSRSTSTFYFSINPFLHTVNVVETWNNNKKNCQWSPQFLHHHPGFSKTLATSLSNVTQFLEGLAPFWGSSNYGCNSGIEF